MPIRTRFLLTMAPAPLAVLLLALCVVFAPRVADSDPYATTGSAHAIAANDCASEHLSIMIGQTIIMGFPGRRPQDQGVEAVLAQLRSGTIGGVVLFPKNIADKTQLKTLINALRETRPDLPPFIAGRWRWSSRGSDST
jgi:beta-N-acetylhexosaminidase